MRHLRLAPSLMPFCCLPSNMTSGHRGRIMTYATAPLIIMRMACATCAAHADRVTDGNHTAIDVMKAANIAGHPWSRPLAMVPVAMSAAIKTVQGRYTRVVVTVPAVPGAAARHILLQLYPNQTAMIDEAYAASLKAIPEDAAQRDGIALGEQAATAVQEDRS